MSKLRVPFGPCKIKMEIGYKIEEVWEITLYITSKIRSKPFQVPQELDQFPNINYYYGQ